MRYSLDQLEAFVLAARNSSISNAARIMGKAQSTVSLAIANLEIDLDVQLFDRAGKFPVLTDAGKSLLAEAESVLFHCRVFEERSLNLMQEVEDTVRLCVDETLPVDLLTSSLAALAQKFPHVRVALEPPSAGGIAELVRAGGADIGLTVVNYHYPEGMAFYRLGRIRLINVVGKHHPLADANPIRFSDLNSYRQLEYVPNVGRFPTNQHMGASSSWSFSTYAAIIAGVRNNLGWAVLPWHLAEPVIGAGKAVPLQLEAYKDVPWRVNIDAIWSSRKRPGAVARWLREFLGNRGWISAFVE